MRAEDVLAALENERKRLLAAFVSLGDDADAIAVTEPGGWTAKDVLAHLIHYCGQIAWALGAQLEPPSYVLDVQEQLSGQQWNERAVAFWRPATSAEVRMEFDRNADLLIERVRLLSDDQLAADAKTVVPWADEGPLWRFIGYDTFLHEWPAHAEQMEHAATQVSPR